MTKRFQIRDEQFGIALYDATTAAQALEDYLADRTRGELKGRIEQSDDGMTATVTVDGRTFTAVG